MLVKITNKTPHNIFLDIDGDERTEDTVQIGPKGKVEVQLPSEKRFLEIGHQYSKQLILRKV